METKSCNDKAAIIRLFRSPTLETVLMVEQATKRYSGELTKRQVWERLPKKVMWSTYKTVLNYLESINKIAVSKSGIIVYIWSPEIARNFMKAKRKLL